MKFRMESLLSLLLIINGVGGVGGDPGQEVLSTEISTAAAD